MRPFHHKYVNIFISPKLKDQSILKNTALQEIIQQGVQAMWKKIYHKARRDRIMGPIRGALVAGEHTSKSDKSNHVTLRWFSGDNIEFSTLHIRENIKKKHRLFSGLNKKLDGRTVKEFKWGLKVKLAKDEDKKCQRGRSRRVKKTYGRYSHRPSHPSLQDGSSGSRLMRNGASEKRDRSAAASKRRSTISIPSESFLKDVWSVVAKKHGTVEGRYAHRLNRLFKAFKMVVIFIFGFRSVID
ncbi:hypothetical protein AGABI1DRAFT_133511 [Agaricus bisporus var. burnettii JB137-S8]|uniref:Uncharacterized protein n=2 Tax=Agaricus bisporus var. burnettii (strain JB137-S8 / ATCC MYA-4627 / FGSC 10392) TaxID=597362 RepID=K5WG18_AGABU|nr:uncharacterized protein AGABI1DRAFT_133511 [Agaricus bisporus var. burnettii JB137-S8]EKM74201.1 hypothetical protein AGABI1DRAFT_133511 [Agaricus bisporus var. burnettii JB137-S8]